MARCILVLALLPLHAAAQVCAWADPGANRFTGDPVEAVRAYTDIPPLARAELAEAVGVRAYTEVVEITRDTIGGGRYTGLRDMHWGAGQRCTGAVDRQAWTPGRVERGLVYCRRGHCVIVPTVCGNVARVNAMGVAAQADPPPERRGAVAGSGLRVQPMAAIRPVPEPGSAWLVLAAVAALAMVGGRCGARKGRRHA